MKPNDILNLDATYKNQLNINSLKSEEYWNDLFEKIEPIDFKENWLII